MRLNIICSGLLIHITTDDHACKLVIYIAIIYMKRIYVYQFLQDGIINFTLPNSFICFLWFSFGSGALSKPNGDSGLGLSDDMLHMWAMSTLELPVFPSCICAHFTNKHFLSKHGYFSYMYIKCLAEHWSSLGTNWNSLRNISLFHEWYNSCDDGHIHDLAGYFNLWHAT